MIDNNNTASLGRGSTSSPFFPAGSTCHHRKDKVEPCPNTNVFYFDIHTHQSSANPNTASIVSSDIRQPVTIDSGYYCVGIHPWYACTADFFIVETLAQHPNVVAIGETGLDKLVSTPLKQQEEMFISHIELAEKFRKPLIIHCVKAWSELIAIHQRFSSDITWIIHGFRGKGELARQLLRFGFYLSFGPHFNPYALHAAWEAHRLYVETDDSTISIEDIYLHISSQLLIPIQALSQEINENIQSWPTSFIINQRLFNEA